MLGRSSAINYSVSTATASKLHMDMATPPRQSLASTMEMTSQRRSSISSQVANYNFLFYFIQYMYVFALRKFIYVGC